MSLTDSSQTVGVAWDQYASAYQDAARLPTDVVSYGPHVGTEADFRLLGPLAGKRVLDLGCGGGQSAIAMAKQGAIAIGIDISAAQLAFARRLADEEEVRVELRQGDLAELAFQRADTTDVVFSALSLQYVADLNRVFRQVHRVLRVGGAFVFSLPHPVAMAADRATKIDKQLSIEAETVTVSRNYFDKSPLQITREDTTLIEYPRTISDIFMALSRSGYRVDTVLEPEIDGGPLPRVLVMRARKEA